MSQAICLARSSYFSWNTLIALSSSAFMSGLSDGQTSSFISVSRRAVTNSFRLSLSENICKDKGDFRNKRQCSNRLAWTTIHNGRKELVLIYLYSIKFFSFYFLSMMSIFFHIQIYLKEIFIVKYIQRSLKIHLFVLIKKSKNGWKVKMMDRNEENVV